MFLGPEASDDDNWRPRIQVVEKILCSWSFSFRSRALVINALALSHIWYVASLVHMLAWVLGQLNKLVIIFFWKGKKRSRGLSCCCPTSLCCRFFCCKCLTQSPVSPCSVGQTVFAFIFELVYPYSILFFFDLQFFCS